MVASGNGARGRIHACVILCLFIRESWGDARTVSRFCTADKGSASPLCLTKERVLVHVTHRLFMEEWQNHIFLFRSRPI